MRTRIPRKLANSVVASLHRERPQQSVVASSRKQHPIMRRRSLSRRVAMLATISALISRWKLAGAFSLSRPSVDTRRIIQRTSPSSSYMSAPAYDHTSSPDPALLAPRRTFQFVPFGSGAPSDVTTISCDGLVSVATLDVTHWTHNKTPQELYADTSTEIALNLARAEARATGDATQRYGHLADAVVVNNHYDTDGVLSVFACLNPALALQHEKLLVAGAEAGDFGEWNSDDGVQLDCALVALGNTCETDADAYDKALSLLPDLLRDVEEGPQEGESEYESLWRTGFDEAVAGYQDLQEGRAMLSKGPGAMAILNERPGKRMSPYALHRGLVELDLWKGTTRILRVDRQPQDDGSHLHRYQYEKVGHGWVTQLKDRQLIPDADGSKLAKAMGGATTWSKGGSSDFISICQSSYISDSPDDVSRKLWELDPGCQ